MNLCYWRMNAKQWRTCYSTLRVSLRCCSRSNGSLLTSLSLLPPYPFSDPCVHDWLIVVSLGTISLASASTDRSITNFFTGSPLAALTTLSFSDNVDLQRSAALAFAEITEKEVREVGRDTLDPVLYLLTSHDAEVQRAASAALGNLAVNGELLPPS